MQSRSGRNNKNGQEMIEPGGTIGTLGGGQLGRMLSVAAAQLGYRTIGYAPDGDNVAAQVSNEFITADWGDEAALTRFAEACDVVTWEFENVPLATANRIPAEKLPCPPRALEVAQDRLLEKQFVTDLGGRPAPFHTVDTPEDLTAAVETIGLPGILKTRRDGYDGKGQWRLQSAQDIEAVKLPDTPLIYEGFVNFEAEFSVILARKADGETVFWDSALNEHSGGILSRSILPAGARIESEVEAARALAKKVADALGYVGVLTLEFFATADGPVFNEMAPRVHNSGHWSIEGAVTSQFENHIRAICDLPLGATTTCSDRVEMTNLIGDEAADLAALLSKPDAHVHLYGKAEAREGRKMGHITQVGRGGAR